MGPYLPVATLTVLTVAGIVGMEVYRQVDKVPAREVEYICNGMAGGCTGEPGLVGPILLTFVAAAVIGVVYRFKNWRADEQE